jgi:hypothetical protein
MRTGSMNCLWKEPAFRTVGESCSRHNHRWLAIDRPVPLDERFPDQHKRWRQLAHQLGYQRICDAPIANLCRCGEAYQWTVCIRRPAGRVVTNSVRFDTMSMSNRIDNPDSFGVYTRTLTDKRVMQMALRLEF